MQTTHSDEKYTGDGKQILTIRTKTNITNNWHNSICQQLSKIVSDIMSEFRTKIQGINKPN